MLYPALLPLMRTPRLPVVDWTDVHCRFKRTRPFCRKTKSGFCACVITFQTQFTSEKRMVGSQGQSGRMQITGAITISGSLFRASAMTTMNKKKTTRCTIVLKSLKLFVFLFRSICFGHSCAHHQKPLNSAYTASSNRVSLRWLCLPALVGH
jgi:hypothetical protein